MPETKRGGKRPGAGRPPGASNKPKDTSPVSLLVPLSREITQAIKDEDWTRMRTKVNMLMMLTRFLPEPPAE